MKNRQGDLPIFFHLSFYFPVMKISVVGIGDDGLQLLQNLRCPLINGPASGPGPSNQDSHSCSQGNDYAEDSQRGVGGERRDNPHDSSGKGAKENAEREKQGDGRHGRGGPLGAFEGLVD